MLSVDNLGNSSSTESSDNSKVSYLVSLILFSSMMFYSTGLLETISYMASKTFYFLLLVLTQLAPLLASI